MSLISSSIPNFVNGVSQQPFTLRLSSQGELQENGLSTVSLGLRKRPPTEHFAKISSTPLSGAFIHTINRDETEQYQVVIAGNDLKVYALDGTAMTVNFTNKPYLVTALESGASFAVTTVADYTFIVNKTRTTLADISVQPARPFEALINVKLGNYGKTYSVTVNGSVVGSYAVPNGATTADAPLAASDAIAAQLVTSMTTGGMNTAPFSISRFGSVIYLKNTSTDFTVTCEDGFGNNAMVAIKGSLQKFSDLPANCRVNGFTVQITGEKSSDFDNYWVAFDGKGFNNNAGVWRETLKPGTTLGVNPLTMPHQLVREANGTFSFSPVNWAQRKVGDIGTNPDPSFLGRKINDIFFFKNRLGFLSDENYIQTETGKYFNVFRTTVTTLLDSDPIDVNAATNKVAILQHAVSFNKQLLIFSAQQQFVVDDTALITPKKVPISPTTDFAVNTRAKPVAAGKNVYFSTDKGLWSSFREFYADQNNLNNDASDVSSHVPKYIPSGIVKIAAGTTEDILVMLSSNARNKLYIYKYYFSGTEKLQSSWSVFTFPIGDTILDCEFIKSVLYLVISRADGVYFEKMDFALGAAIFGEPFSVLLDRKVQVNVGLLSWDGVNTVISAGAIPYTPNDGGTYMAVMKGGGAIKAGEVVTVFYDGQIKVPGNFTASGLTFGKAYSWKYTVSPLTLKVAAAGGGMKSDTEGRTQVRRIAFNHADTGYYKVIVTPEARSPYTYVFTGKILGSTSAAIGAATLATGRFACPVMSRNTTVTITLESSLPNPVSILSADWEAYYVKRSNAV